MDRRLFEGLALSSGAQTKIFLSVAIILVLWVGRALVLRAVRKRIEDPAAHYRWRKVSTYVSVIAGILLVGGVWLAALQQVGTFLGLLSAGLAIALRDPVADVAGWIFILARRPFRVGDRIQIGAYAGDVIDIRFFKFTLMEIGGWVGADQSTGRVIHVPNSLVLREPVANYSQGFEYIWTELPVAVTFESDWQKAKAVLESIVQRYAEPASAEAQARLREAARRYLIVYSVLTPTVYTSVVDHGVCLTLRFLVAPRRRRGVEQAVWEDILREFARHDDIDFAYPTTRFFDHRLEGKPGLRPPGPPAAG